MVDVKKILQTSLEEGRDTIGMIMGDFVVRFVMFKETELKKYDPTREEPYNEFKRLLPIWKKKYGFDEFTKVTDVLAKLEEEEKAEREK